MRYSGLRPSFEIKSKEVVGEKAVIAKDKNCKKCLIPLHWFVQQVSTNDNILHYLCELLFGGKAETKQSSNIQNNFQESCKLWGSIYQTKRLFNRQRSRCFGT